MSASLRDSLPTLFDHPYDVRDNPVERADGIAYRLGLRALPLPGLPSSLTVGDVIVEFTRGPVRAQHTLMRQRHGIPITFDKCLLRPEVGDGELLVLFSIWARPVPNDIDSALVGWRGRALAAAGLVASILDERVVGSEVFEDALLFAQGDCLGAVDRRSIVRSYLPFDVHAGDIAALEMLSRVAVEESSRTARAARLYRRAALEGPTADAYAMLWVAAECFSERRSPSRPEIETALADAGIDPASLPLHVGLLIDFRARVQHHGFEDLDTLRLAFYEMEAVVRVLIRRDLGITGGWWPALNPQAFADPFDEAVAEAMGPGETVWHAESLPPVSDPVPQRVPRRASRPPRDPRVQIDDSFGDHVEVVARTVVETLEWQDPDASLAIHLGLPPSAAGDTDMVSSADGVWIAAERLEGLADPARPEKLANFVWDLTAIAGASLAQRTGLISEGNGSIAIQAMGAWGQYLRLIRHGPFDPNSLVIPPPSGPISLGKLIGWAAAGDPRARPVVDDLEGELGEFSRELVAALSSLETQPPFHLVSAAEPTSHR